MLNITIRPYTEQDQEQLIMLWEKVFPGAPPHNNPAKDLRIRRDVPRDHFLVAIHGDAVIGVVMAGCDGLQGWVYYLGVDPGFRRQGIGTSLMKRVETRLLEKGCQELSFQIWASNAEVQAFYETLGYQAEDRRTMRKRL
jgi:ribosomal protein S18 acetylase RimI-like enzyme